MSGRKLNGYVLAAITMLASGTVLSYGGFARAEEPAQVGGANGEPSTSEAEGHLGAHDAEHAHGPEAINWIQFGGTRASAEGGTRPNPPPFIASLFNFAIVVAVLMFAVRRLVNPALASRRAAMEAEIGEAQRMRAQAEAVHREYTDRLARLDQELATMRAEYQSAGALEFERIVTEARAKAARLEQDARSQVDQEVRALRADLTREAVEAAMASAEKAVRTQIAPADQTRLADEYLADLERKGAAPGATATASRGVSA